MRTTSDTSHSGMPGTDKQPPQEAVVETVSRGIFKDVVHSIFEPGINRGVAIVLHATFVLLLLTLCFLLFLTGGTNVHIYFVLLLAVAVYGGIFWYGFHS